MSLPCSQRWDRVALALSPGEMRPPVIKALHSNMVHTPRGAPHPASLSSLLPLSSDFGNVPAALLIPPLSQGLEEIPETPTVISASVKEEDRLFFRESIDRLPARMKTEDSLLSARVIRRVF
jgi:hypothetical protein